MLISYKRKVITIDWRNQTKSARRSRCTLFASCVTLRRTQEHLCSLPARNTKPISNNEETADKPKMRSILLKGKIAFFHKVNVIKDKERLTIPD